MSTKKETKLGLFIDLIKYLGALLLLTCATSITVAKPLDQKKLGAINLPFIANQGQLDSRVKFYAETFGGTTFVTTDGKLVHQFTESTSKIDKSSKFYSPSDPLFKSAKSKSSDSRNWALVEELVNAQSIPRIDGEHPSISRISSFIGTDSSKWQLDMPAYGSVNLGEIYPHINYRLKAYGNNVEKLFTVQPGGNPGNIMVRLKGALALKIAQEGTLEADTKFGPIRFTTPIAYQEKNGVRIPVSVNYVLKGNQYGFNLGEYDKTADVIIDPLLQSTYFSGDVTGATSIQDMALDAEGNVYVTGWTLATNFPGITGGAQTTIASTSGTDAFVAKLNSDLTVLIQATYIGGARPDYGEHLKIDSLGNIYITGATYSIDFPKTVGGAQSSHVNGTTDYPFIVKLNNQLTTIIQATYLSGTHHDVVSDLALDHLGNVYVAGTTESNDFPNTSLGAQPTNRGGVQDGFVAKLNSGLTTLIQSTYLGGNDRDDVYAIAIDLADNVFVSGSTSSTNLLGTSGGLQPVYTPGRCQNMDGFVFKLNNTLSNIIQATYLGGSGCDSANSLTFDSIGNIYIAGVTDSSDFPSVVIVRTPDPRIISDDPRIISGVYLLKLNSALNTKLGSFFLKDGFYPVITLDVLGNVYVAGTTSSTNFVGTTGGALGWCCDLTPLYNFENKNVFIAKLDSALTGIIQATYFGGTNDDFAVTLALNATGDIYVSGTTLSTDLPGVFGGFQPICTSCISGGSYIGKFSSLNKANSSNKKDLNADNKSDLLWRNTTGQTAIWLMDGATIANGVYLPNVSSDWSIAQVADFNGDGKADVLWRSTSGQNAIWLMNGATIASGVYLPNVSSDWSVAQVADFNGDGKADVLWRSTSGQTAIWLMNGATIASGVYLPNVSSDWSVVQVADFNGDGKSDVLWRSTSGQTAIWLMNGATIASGVYLPNVSSDWSVAQVADFNGDGKADVLWRNTAGQTAIWLMNGASIASGIYLPNVSSDWSVVQVADFNGDGKADLLWRNTSGQTAVWLMNGTSIASGVYLPNVSSDWSVAKVADFNGDGKADLLWRNTAGQNAIWLMNGAAIASGVYLPNVSSDWSVIKN